MSDNVELTVRLDKWLWAARFFRTCTLARAAIKQGKVLYDDVKPKPARTVNLGDKLTIQQGYETKVVIVTGLCSRRRNAEEAQKLYKETQESISERNNQANARQEAKKYQLNPNPYGRPDKQVRRKIRYLRRQNFLDEP